MVISGIRRRILEEKKESDIDYVKRLFLECQLLHPCSGYGVNRNNVQLLLRDTVLYNDDLPKRRAVFVIDKTKIKLPASWWGSAGQWHILPTANNYSMIHIPASINKITIKHTNSTYETSAIIFNGLTTPKWDSNVQYSSSWYGANSIQTINLSSVHGDRWLWFHCHRRNNEFITYTSLEQLKASFNLQVTVE